MKYEYKTRICPGHIPAAPGSADPARETWDKFTGVFEEVLNEMADQKWEFAGTSVLHVDGPEGHATLCIFRRPRRSAGDGEDVVMRD